MSFKRIEVLGFKSFADKLGIEFSNGITAIVGPNGCGKSNFADAIRWVLGEQSSKNLRGSSMQDVIFKGSETRKSLSYCEVSLIFSNENHQFNLDYDEVVISRKLYRSGTSEYSLNHSPCLLKDITALLHDSGIGRDGYSIIGQGKVEQIVASKPEDRRVIFEEAAGIAKFKERKIEAERKLTRTRENLSLIENTVIEIERQLMPMREQAEKAKKYLDLREQLKFQEVNNYIYHYENANSNKQRISDMIEGLKEQSIDKEKQVQSAIEKQNQSLEGIKAIDEQIQTLRDEVLKLTVSLEKTAGDRRVAQAKIQYLVEQAQKLEQEIVQDKADFDKINNELQEKQVNKSNNVENLNSMRAKLDELEQIYAGVMEQLKVSEQAVSGSQQEMQDAISKISDIKANISRLQAEITAISERETELETKKISVESKKEGALVIENQARLDCESAEANRRGAWDNLTALRETFASVEQGEKDLRLQLDISSAELAKLESRAKLLNEMQAEYEGYNGTVRRLLLDAGKNVELQRLLVGVVGELITVPQNLETAIEIALGFAVQNIVTRDEQDAKQLVAYLKSKNYGRATFLPINSMKPKYLNDSFRPLLNTAGCYGVANELIEYDSNLAPVFKGLLGNTVIVDNMETAVRLANSSHFGFKIVTLEGDVINPAGSITGGSKKAEINNLLSREREIETIAEKIKTLTAKVEEEKTTLKAYADMLVKLTREIDAQTNMLHECDVELAQKNEMLRHSQEDSQLYTSELDEINQELSRIHARKDILERELATTKAIDGGDMPTAKGGGKSSNQYDILRDKRDSLTEQITDLKVNIATLTAEITSIDSEVERLLGEQEELSACIDENNSLLVKNSRTIETARELDANADNGNGAEISAKLDAVKAKVVEMEELKLELHASLAGIEEERTRVTNEFARIQERIYQEEAKLAQIDTNIENMQDRILEDYELTYLTALDLKDPDYDSEGGQARINDLKREISRLGHVNVNAIEDSKDLDARYTDLSTQLADLKKAEEDIMTVINELSSQMTERFDTQFQKINENFSRIFRELFGGGKARLVLTDDDVLTAGVDIIAEPPGKALGNINLLSGGEKSLTAIAILFAILKLRPMPFCLLDEIDAALDDANVERFAKYLHRFAGETQFIVITHRKPTMELADNLYGVTMENKGV
ncbi:MAG: chromosome segregation protein SMC, partial [Clostridia bacterium]|nr:chromosome segregation protein SMC [Clostridia bacterium]